MRGELPVMQTGGVKQVSGLPAVLLILLERRPRVHVLPVKCPEGYLKKFASDFSRTLFSDSGICVLETGTYAGVARLALRCTSNMPISLRSIELQVVIRSWLRRWGVTISSNRMSSLHERLRRTRYSMQMEF